MAKLHEYFLKAIFKEKEIFNENKSITLAVSCMAKYTMPNLISDEKDYSLYYKVPLKTIQDCDLDEEQVYELRQHGWILDESENNIIRPI